jgi:large subunit ribosomal protein MRP49
MIFDAKYRIAPGGGVPEDALADAYTYRAAIGADGRTATIGTFLLYPGEQGFDAGGVGAVPLFPGNTSGLETVIRRYLLAN